MRLIMLVSFGSGPDSATRTRTAKTREPGRSDRPRAEPPHVAEAAPDADLEGFLALLAARRAPRTVEAYRRDLAALAGWLGRPPATASTDDLERWVAELRA